MRTLRACVLLFALCGCSGDGTKPYISDQLAVFGYLYVGEGITGDNPILITRAGSIDEFYEFDDAVVTNALVTIRREGAAAAETLRMGSPGYYLNPEISIEEETTYHLTIAFDGETVVTASTTTPIAFGVSRGPVEAPETMRHGAIPDSFPILLSCRNEEQVFLVDVFCEEDWEDARYINPFGPTDEVGSYQEYGYENDPPRHIFAYFRIKDIERVDEEYRIGWYGDMMVFYGGYEVQVLSIDENYYNYLYRDHPELSGGVEGGIGVFGSARRSRYSVEVVE